MADRAQLLSDVASLRSLVQERDVAIEERDTEIAQLREYIRLLRSQRFGASSERTHRDQLGLFNEAEQLADAAVEEPPIAVPAHTRAKAGRRPLPAWMERVEILHDLPEAEKICASDGTALVEIGRESSEQIEFIPATARLRRLVTASIKMMPLLTAMPSSTTKPSSAIGPASEVRPVPVSISARQEPMIAVGRVQKMTIGEENDSNSDAKIMYTRIAAIPIIQ